METQERIRQLSPVKQFALRKLLEDKDVGEQARLALTGSNLRMLRQGSPILFIYPATDGSVGYMRHYLPHIPARWGVYALQTPGLEGEQEPYRTVHDLARHGIARIREVQPSGPYYLAGNCMGGLPAYETARQLHAAGEQVALVLHLLPNFNRPWKDLPTSASALQLRAIIDYVYIIERLLGTKIDLPFDEMAALDERDQLDRVVDLVHRGGWLGAADPDTFRARMVIYQANLGAMLSYAPPSAYPGEITILAAGEDARGESAVSTLSPYAAPLHAVHPDRIRTIVVDADGGALFDGSEPAMTRIGTELQGILCAL